MHILRRTFFSKEQQKNFKFFLRRNIECTPSQRESDRQRIAVTSRKQSILGNEVKGRAFLQYGLFIVDDDFHKCNVLPLLLAKVAHYISCKKDIKA